MKKPAEKYYSTTEAAKILSISRVAVFNRVKNKTIKAQKVGRNFMIPASELGLPGTDLDLKLKQKVNKGVEKVLRDYRKTIQLLGAE